MSYIRGILLGLDQLSNAAIGGGPDETISSRTGRLGLGGALDHILNRIQVDHSVRSVEYTPWGTVDPHHMNEVDAVLASDWDSFDQIMRSSKDADAFTPETLEAAEKAAKRLRYWVLNGGQRRWGHRMARDLYVGDVFESISKGFGGVGKTPPSD